MKSNSASVESARDVDAQLQSLLPIVTGSGSADPDSQPEIFHERTKYHRATIVGQRGRIIKYLMDPVYMARGAVGYNEFPYLEALELPPPPPLSMPLGETLKKRASCREFEGPVTMEQVSALFHYALRPTRRAKPEILPYLEFAFRPYPSPGNLNSLEPYAFLNNVTGVTPSAVHYDQRAHNFRVLKRDAGDAFARAEIRDGDKGIPAPLVMVLTMVPQRMTGKYGDRGYRFALLEAGHAAQNICLVAEALGLSALVYASFYDDELAAELNIDGVTETVATTILIGPRKPKAAK